MKKRVLIIGVGQFGKSILQEFYKFGYEIIVIDADEKIIQQLNDEGFDILTFTADATDEKIYESFLTKENFIDVAVVSIGEDIRSSILISLLLKEHKVKQIIAKANDYLHGKVLEKILDIKNNDRVVYPEREMAKIIAHQINWDEKMKTVMSFGNYQYIQINTPKKFIGKTLRELNLRNNYEANLIGIEDSNGINFSIGANTKIKEGDILHLIINKEYLDKLTDDSD